MRYLVLAVDYDGTLAHDGVVDEAALSGLERLLASGRKLVLVTGRRWDDLCSVFAHTELFEWVVADNGAVLHAPSTGAWRTLGELPPAAFIDDLRAQGVEPLEIGHVIVATRHPHEGAVLEAIRKHGLELQVIFNKGAVMILPGGVNKASGLAAALQQMRISPHNVVAIGDAENDHAMLGMVECAAAVSNALESLQQKADVVTKGDRGRGVVELIDRLIADDLRSLDDQLTRHELLVGNDPQGAEVRVPACNANVLITGASGSGKSAIATGLLEQLVHHKYQFLVIDPEGDYEIFEGAVTLGGSRGVPTADEIVALLADPGQNVVVNLIGLKIVDRPPFLLSLLPRLQELRAKVGRPHWLVIDEAHHVLPASWEPAQQALPKEADRFVLITLDPALLPAGVLKLVTEAIAVGDDAPKLLGTFSQARELKLPPLEGLEVGRGKAIYWPVGRDQPPRAVTIAPTKTEHQRHIRKYAEGELPPDRSFFFTGPEGKLNLRARNLFTFLELAEGIDEATWEFHLRQKDFSRWFREAIKDEDLAGVAAGIEDRQDVTAADSLKEIRAAIDSRYTLGSSPTLPIAGTDAAAQFQNDSAKSRK